MMSRWFLTTVFGFLLAVATCQAGPKRNKYYNQVEDLMSNDVFEDDSFDRTGSRALSRAINVNVNPKTPLLFRTNVKKKPKKKNLQTRRLMRKMGSDYDSVWMSIESPEKAGIEPRTVEMSSEQVAELVEQVSNLHLEQELSEITDDLDQQMVSVFQQWLVKKSTCPVTHEWRDLGEYFWPRWIKTGACSSSTTSSEVSSPSSSGTKGCSWPKGMRCVQGEVKSLHILRWHCRRKKKRAYGSSNSGGGGGSHRGRKQHRCQWYKVPYPVTQSCKCSCQE